MRMFPVMATAMPAAAGLVIRGRSIPPGMSGSADRLAGMSMINVTRVFVRVVYREVQEQLAGESAGRASIWS